MKNINLEWLKTFDTFARSQNINEAAHALGISQPAVTLHLKNLENQFELPLFQTIGRKKVLTVFGKEFFQLVTTSLSELDRSVEHLKLLHSNAESSVIRIGGRRELLEKVLVKLNSAVHIKAIENDTDGALSKLKSLDLDVAISHYRPDSADLIAKVIFKEKAKLVVHPKLLKSKKINPVTDPNFLMNTPVFFYKDDPPYLNELFRHLKLDLTKVNPQAVIGNWNVIISLIEKASGYAIVPSSFPLSKELLVFDLPAKIDRSIEVYAVFHTSARKSKVLMEFIKEF